MATVVEQSIDSEPPVLTVTTTTTIITGSDTENQSEENTASAVGTTVDNNANAKFENVKKNDCDDPDDDLDDLDDDEDEVDVIIKEPSTFTASIRPGSKTLVNSACNIKPAPKSGIDLDDPGDINGHATADFNISLLNDEEKAWKRPGADITDYFNYGFSEDTWLLYCEKQRAVRGQLGSNLKPLVMSNLVNSNRAKSSTSTRAANPINVVASSVSLSDNTISTSSGGTDAANFNPNVPPPGYVGGANSSSGSSSGFTAANSRGSLRNAAQANGLSVMDAVAIQQLASILGTNPGAANLAAPLIQAGLLPPNANVMQNRSAGAVNMGMGDLNSLPGLMHTSGGPPAASMMDMQHRRSRSVESVVSGEELAACELSGHHYGVSSMHHRQSPAVKTREYFEQKERERDRRRADRVPTRAEVPEERSSYPSTSRNRNSSTERSKDRHQSVRSSRRRDSHSPSNAREHGSRRRRRDDNNASVSPRGSSRTPEDLDRERRHSDRRRSPEAASRHNRRKRHHRSRSDESQHSVTIKPEIDDPSENLTHRHGRRRHREDRSPDVSSSRKRKRRGRGSSMESSPRKS